VKGPGSFLLQWRNRLRLSRNFILHCCIYMYRLVEFQQNWFSGTFISKILESKCETSFPSIGSVGFKKYTALFFRSFGKPIKIHVENKPELQPASMAPSSIPITGSILFSFIFPQYQLIYYQTKIMSHCGKNSHTSIQT